VCKYFPPPPVNYILFFGYIFFISVDTILFSQSEVILFFLCFAVDCFWLFVLRRVLFCVGYIIPFPREANFAHVAFVSTFGACGGHLVWSVYFIRSWNGLSIEFFERYLLFNYFLVFDCHN
jgi:hypothetical protein